MHKLLIILLLTLGSMPLHAADNEIPTVEAAIPDSVKNLSEPAIFPFTHGLQSAITAATPRAQNHTNQGINHLHGGWEFEAARHFATAIREDPDCLMAHWGLVMSMLAPSPETDAARIAASERMLVLINDGQGTELERGFAYGLVKYIQEGPQGAANAFRTIAEKFPNDPQAAIFAALFSRTGYNDLGQITPNQENSEKILLSLIEKYPENAVPIHSLLTIRAEAPDLRPSLDLARKLTQLVPDYAPYFHLLGHYEWRCGEHVRAARAFARASTLFSNWMRDNTATVADCPQWVIAESYRTISLASNGDFENAYASAVKLSTATPDPKRPGAPGTRAILWEAQTLPARILLRQNLPGNPAKALASLPKPEASAPFRDTCLAHWWIDGLRITLESHRLLEAKTIEPARQAIDALSHHGEAMSQLQAAAAGGGERASWNRAFRALELLAADLRGHLALAGPKTGHGSAFNWFRAAIDRQKPATMLNPPLILTPIAINLGDYYLANKQLSEAIAAYTEALSQFPNDQPALTRLLHAYELNQQPEKAADIKAIIDARTQ